MNKSLTQEHATSPLHIGTIFQDVWKHAKKFRGLQVSMDQDNAAASRITMSGDLAKPSLEVVVSHIVDKEDTIAVVFRNTSKPLGQDSVTRHYQPARYLGKNALGESNSAVFSTDATRQPREQLAIGIFYYLYQGTLPVDWKPSRTSF